MQPTRREQPWADTRPIEQEEDLLNMYEKNWVVFSAAEKINHYI